MADLESLRQAALALPDVDEAVHRGGPAFRVGGKTCTVVPKRRWREVETVRSRSQPAW